MGRRCWASPVIALRAAERGAGHCSLRCERRSWGCGCYYALQFGSVVNSKGFVDGEDSTELVTGES
jgi:hypothetical protein